MNFKKINNLTGWAVFAIATIVYLSTLEATASLWDCGEFLSTAYKLEVGHSPGAPLFMMMGRFFMLFAPSIDKVAWMVNAMSGLASSFTILFLFWSITHFARKIVAKEESDTISTGSILAIMGAGVVGALAYTFSDTFWFSAVEGEVYATSSFFTAISFWAILKWEHAANTDPRADRWLILIFYLIGLSIGVHLLNLLILPAVAVVYYLRRYNASLTGGIVAFLIGGVILGLVQFGMIQFIPILASKFELAFVNSFGLPFNSGAYFFFIALAVAIFFILRYARKKNKYMVQLGTLCFTFALIGYSSYVSTIVRSKADVPIDMVNPDNIISLVPYLQREQYGSQPLVFGGNYYSDVEYDAKDEGKPTYSPTQRNGKDYYEIVGHRQDPTVTNPLFFPRMWERQKADAYESVLGLSKGETPSFGDNLRFFFGYQVNWMYWRYFMWNYAGRQNDIEGQGESKNGNWISGITPLDKMMGKGDTSIASNLYAENRANNKYYLLPFALGILGLLYQYKKDKKDFSVVGVLFFMTGLAIVVYLNNGPMQPRERDYAYISTYAFAIWIGLGVMQISEWLRGKTSATVAPIIATVICLLAVPTLMATQNWDDHDRSPKTIARDHAFNMLSSCDSNAILIVNGDNDTYPLWYLQEVEGFRTDVRILNQNLLNTDWQNEQMFYKINDADATPNIWTPDMVKGDRLEYTYFVPDPRVPANAYFSINDVMKYLADTNNMRLNPGSNTKIAVMPTKRFSLDVDRAAVLRSGLVKASDSARILSQLLIDRKDANGMQKADLSIMSMVAGIARDGWKRSIYFGLQTPAGGFEPYLQKMGLLSKLVPTSPALPNVDGFTQTEDLDKSMNLFIKVYTLGKAKTDKVYFDEKNKNTLYQYRVAATDLATNLSMVGRQADAVKVMDATLGKMSESAYPTAISAMDNTGIAIVDAYYRAGARDKARAYAAKLIANADKDTDYFVSLSEGNKDGMMGYTQQVLLRAINNMAQIAQQFGDTEKAAEWNQKLQQIADRSGMGDMVRAKPQAAPQQQVNPQLK